MRAWLVIAGIAGFVSVAAGAFGAHALRERIPPALFEVYQTGAHYALVHAVALLAVAVLAGQGGGRAVGVAGAGFALGIVLFAGSLWLMALTGHRWPGAITPLGGIAFLIGWVALLLAGWRG